MKKRKGKNKDKKEFSFHFLSFLPFTTLIQVILSGLLMNNTAFKVSLTRYSVSYSLISQVDPFL